jgi:splicing factor 3B subunit 4
MVKLYGKAIRINKASQDKTNSSDVGANLFIGNLDPDVDEKVGQSRERSAVLVADVKRVRGGNGG